MDEQKLNRKLAEWAGFKVEYRRTNLEGELIEGETGIITGFSIYPDKTRHLLRNQPDFTQSLDACFKWLVPKLNGWLLQADYPREEVWAVVKGNGDKEFDARAEAPALALCLAIEKLIDSGGR